LRGLEHRRDGDHAPEIEARPTGLGCDAQHEIAAEGETDELQRSAAEALLQGAHRPDHLRQPAGVKELAIEMMRLAMVAKVEPYHLEAPLEELLREREDVERLCAALPAVQHHHRRTDAAVGARDEALQPHPGAAIEQLLVRSREERHRPPQHAAAAPGDARQHRLHMRVAQPARRPEVVLRGKHGNGSPRLQCTRISTLLLALAARFHSPAVR
jgi:hypothetical protein